MKRIRQFSAFTLLALLLICIHCIPVAAASVNVAPNMRISSREAASLVSAPPDVIVSGRIPQAVGTPGASLQKDINNAIGDIIHAEVKNISSSTVEIYFEYNTVTDGDTVSLLIRTTLTAASSQNKVASVNYNTASGKLIKITDTDILGPNAVKLVNKAISADMKAHPEKYNATFSGIGESQDFSYQKGLLTLLFNEYEIAPGSEGIVSFDMSLDNVRHCYVPKRDYDTELSSKYSFKMVQLSQVVAEFGYKLDWIPETKEIFVRRADSEAISLQLGKNEYTKGISAAARSLEAAPQIGKDDRTYVPISFFEEILGLSYSVDAQGRITFSEYIAPK